MNKEHTNLDTKLMRKSINALDKIYSKKESLEHLLTLKEIETKLFSSGYGSYEEFKTDLQKIPFYETLKEDAYVK